MHPHWHHWWMKTRWWNILLSGRSQNWPMMGILWSPWRKNPFLPENPAYRSETRWARRPQSHRNVQHLLFQLGLLGADQWQQKTLSPSRSSALSWEIANVQSVWRKPRGLHWYVVFLPTKNVSYEMGLYSLLIKYDYLELLKTEVIQYHRPTTTLSQTLNS